MLVYAKTPRGVLYLGGFQIWGKETGREPIDIPFDLYKMNRDCLQDGTYREGILNKLFKKSFPEIAFTYGEIRYLPEITLDSIGPLMIKNYDATWSHKKKVDQIKIGLADVSPTH